MTNVRVALGILAAVLVAGDCLNAQLPSGSDVNTAIPIYFQQMVNDLGDVKTAPLKVYSITLSKNQQIAATLSVAATAPTANLDIELWGPGTTTLANCTYNRCNPTLAYQVAPNTHSVSFSYTASADGVYYVLTSFGSNTVNYTLEVTTKTPPVPPACNGGNLTGQVDFITYSLTLIAAGLPDSASVGGTQLCPTCTIKAPQYPDIAQKMETAMGLNLPVSLCYDGTGNILQITLKHP
jgi:hypothetical protein